MTGARVYLTRSAARDQRPDAHLHWKAPRRPFIAVPGSACGDHRLADETGRDPTTVPEERRCRAGGCRELWHAVEHPADLFTHLEEAL